MKTGLRWKYFLGRNCVAFCTLASLALSLNGLAQNANERPQPPQNIRTLVPDENTLARLIWSTLISLDNANRTDDYSILNRLGSPQFQTRNSPQQLSVVFSELRRNRVDVGRTVLSTPTYYQPPQIMADGTLRLRGGFDYRPKSIRFDVLYKQVGGGWRIHALSVVEMDASVPKN